MRTSVFRFPLDVNQSQSQATITAGVGETGVRLIIRMMENGSPFEIEPGSYATFSAIKPDGNPIFNSCMIFSQGTVVYDFTEQTVAMAGVTPCQIFVFDPSGTLILSPKFTLVVHENVFNAKQIESTSEFTQLVDFVAEASSIRNHLAIHHKEIYGDEYDAEDENGSHDGNSRIDTLESARTITGGIMINSDDWQTNAEGSTYTHTYHAKLNDNPVQSGDVVLLAPASDQTRALAANLSVTVASMVVNGETVDGVVIDAMGKPEIPLFFRYVVVKKGLGDENLTAVAAMVGVTDVPQYVKEAVSGVTHLQSLTPRFGTLTLPTSVWNNDEKTTSVSVSIPADTLRNGALMVVVPANDETKKVVAEQGMSMAVDATLDSVDEVYFERMEGSVPKVALVFRYAVIYADVDDDPAVTLVGGLGGGGGSGGIYFGSDFPPPTASIWIDPTGDPSATEPWEFDMDAGGTTTKRVVVLETITGGGN